MKLSSFLIMFFIALFCLSSPARANDLFDLDKTPWGMNRKDTAKAIGIRLPPSVTKDSGMAVTGYELDGLDGNMGYVFFNDELVEVHFKLSSEDDPNFSSRKAVLLQQRLERQFNRNYGTKVIDNQQCDNVPFCNYAVWHKDQNTAVGLYLTDSTEGRDLGISYMQRLDKDTDSPFWEPHQGLSILPAPEDQP